MSQKESREFRKSMDSILVEYQYVLSNITHELVELSKTAKSKAIGTPAEESVWKLGDEIDAIKIRIEEMGEKIEEKIRPIYQALVDPKSGKMNVEAMGIILAVENRIRDVEYKVNSLVTRIEDIKSIKYSDLKFVIPVLLAIIGWILFFIKG